MDVSIIIVNYNTISLLVDAVDSVFEKTEGIEYEIIVVDNNSTDNSKNIISEKYGNKVIYLALPENIGFGRANNEAAKIAKGRNLFFLNPDTILLNNTVKILSDYLDNNPKAGVCGGNLYDADGNPTNSFARLMALSIFGTINVLFGNLPEKMMYGKNINFNYTNKPLKVFYITGADLMIKKNIFNRLHGFDPDFFMYYEEVELEYRVSKAGYKVFSIPYAKIVHLEGKSFSNKFERTNKYVLSHKIFIEKITNKVTLFIIYILVYILIITRILIFFILQKKEKKYIWLRKYKKYSKDFSNSIFEYIKLDFIG
jgi:GT2 family glycosyltransferase